MKTNRQDERESLPVEQVGTAGRRPRQTRVRARCKGANGARDEVKAQVSEALPHIVRANVEKAKQGSLVHTKWLWGVMEKEPARRGGDASKRGLESLALLLVEQLKGE